MRLAALTFALLAAAPATSSPGSPALTRAEVSWSEADALSRKLEALDKRRRARPPGPAETVEVTEGELNSYLNLSLGPKMPPWLADVAVRLERERMQATGLVDLDRVRDKIPSLSPWSPLYWLSGQVPVLLRGRLLNRDGFGTMEWEEVRVASVPLPVSVLEQLVASATRDENNPEGFDIRAPFRLPYSAQRVRLEPGRALLDF